MIKLIRNYTYDNKYTYTKSFGSKTDQLNYFNSLLSITDNELNEENEQGYIKEGESFVVNYNYDYLVSLGVNYILFNNGYKDIFAFITNKEYLSEDMTRLNYEIDVMQTFMFDFTLRKSFIERKKCTIDELTDYDEGIDTGEHYISSTWDVITKNSTFFAIFGGFKDYNVVNNVVTETPLYSVDRPITKIDDIVYPFMLIALDTEIGINAFYKYLVDLPNLLGIVRFPNCFYNVTTMDIPLIKMVDGNIIKTSVSCPKVVTSVNGLAIEGLGLNIPKSELTDFFPYTFYVLTDGESEPLIMHPQHLQSNVTIYSKFALSHIPVERYYPSYYKGDTTGKVYNVTNSSVMMLPTGNNGGLETIVASASQITQQKGSMITNILAGVVVGAVGLATGGIGIAVGAVALGASVASGINTVKENIARNKDIELTPSTIKSYGTPSTRDVFGTNKVRVLKYTIKDSYKTRLLNFIDRYGNKYNNYGIVDIKTYKGYIKFIQPNIDGKMDNIYLDKITNILEGGIYIE
jgi:hypothetical protein